MSEENIIQKLSSAVNYIEENIYSKITLDRISQHTGISKFHLHKVFGALTGKKLIEYVRVRKLVHSINELLNTDLRIIDIAAQYSYEHEQAYIKAFKSTFNLSPSRFRKEKINMAIPEIIDIKQLIQINFNSFAVSPVIKRIACFHAVGIKHILRFSGLEDEVFEKVTAICNDFYYLRSSEIKNAPDPEICLNLLDISEGDCTSVMPCLRVTEVAGIPEGMVSVKVPENTYAIVKYVGFHHPSYILDEYKQIFKYLFGKWQNESEYAISGRYIIEKSYNQRENFSEIDIAVPVIKKTGVTGI